MAGSWAALQLVIAVPLLVAWAYLECITSHSVRAERSSSWCLIALADVLQQCEQQEWSHGQNFTKQALNKVTVLSLYRRQGKALQPNH